jgi:tetratricopeptide (TPR) repeat protein
MSMASPSFSAERSQWQSLMTQGSFARQRHDFVAAEQMFLSAQSEAEKLSNDERFLTLYELGNLYSGEGKYDQAEEALQKALSISPCFETASKLAEVYEIRNQPDAAKSLREKYFRNTMPDERKWVEKVIQPAIRKNWVPPKRMVSQFSVVEFRVNPGPPAQPVAYLAESAGDSALDKACLNAVEALRLALPETFKEPLFIDFTFDYNVFDSTSYTDENGVLLRKNLTRFQAQYQTLRQRVAEQEKKLGPDHIEVASTLRKAASYLDDLKQYTPATQAYRRALEIVDNQTPVSSNALSINSSLGEILIKQKKYVDAEKHLRRSEELAEALYPAESETVVGCKKSLASVLGKLGRKEERRALLATIPAKKEKPSQK